MELIWNSYRYYPYEKVLATREIFSLLRGASYDEIDDGLLIHDVEDADLADRLTYFSGYVNGHGFMPTVQARLENSARSGKTRQSTRYSAHGLHEYKGKFNPQVARAILNIFSLQPNDRVLDPFCGSGTTLVECAHLGIQGYGTDLNPLAILMANAKLQALVTPAGVLRRANSEVAKRVSSRRSWRKTLPADARTEYLMSWFETKILQGIEILRMEVLEICQELAPIFLVVASDLLREYSLQDPNDLRIRRRQSPLPSVPFAEAFLTSMEQKLKRIEAAQKILGNELPIGKALLEDVGSLDPGFFAQEFDAAITSPPYAMALPYIDTQRLSLVWLDLIGPKEIRTLESELIGSREFIGPQRREALSALSDNTARLPNQQAEFCLKLSDAIGKNDGFRRQAVPLLLYRYFAAMQRSFRSLSGVIKSGGPYALIVGHNHTTLGGDRFNIDTPRHLASLAEAARWKIEESVPLQTYRRYGYHSRNAVDAESLLILRNR